MRGLPHVRRWVPRGPSGLGVLRALVATVGLLAACGGGSPAAPDATGTPDAPGPDAPETFPACAEFSSAGVSVPAHVVGTLGNADVESPSTCGVVDAPFGIESAGPDRVVVLNNLTIGMPYVVHLVSTSDLAFYVVTGCSTPTGPGADQCQLFEDATSGDEEVGRFVAGGTTAYVVIDYYASSPPPSLAFVLDVYPEQCRDGGPICGGATPVCYEGQCVGCQTSFDCTSAAAPVCGTGQMCVAGSSGCLSDGTDEPGNDGPAGATQIAVDGTGHAAVAGKVCSNPRTEADFFSFDVTSVGETWQFQLGWLGGRDLDLHAFDATGKELGMSFWEQPEQITLTYLPVGRYYLRVREFVSTPDPVPVSYTLAAQRTLGAGCASSHDCATEYRNQLLRARCDAGACVPIEGNGAVPEGGACDSQSDCSLALHCPSFFFVSDGDTRETCSRSCGDDTDCAPLGAGYVCTTYFSNNFCVEKCTEDAHCPTSPTSAPTTGPWRRLTCNVPTGRCVP